MGAENHRDFSMSTYSPRLKSVFKLFRYVPPRRYNLFFFSISLVEKMRKMGK